MEEVLFISHKNFVSSNTAEGGVKYCTDEYLKLLQCGYKINIVPVEYSNKVAFKIKSKLGIDVYEEYNPAVYNNIFKNAFVQQKVTKVFINLANAAKFATYIKTNFVAHNIKCILCSHGNESGDFLHQTVRFPNTLSFLKRIFSAYRLGKTLQQELKFRLTDIDVVLTVSEVEKNIEHWLAAKNIYYVPRVFNKQFLPWQPQQNVVGFVGDVSHYPNYYGLQQLCKALQLLSLPTNFTIFVVGKPCANLLQLTTKFTFIKQLGFLDNSVLQTEVIKWNYYLNPVFYYSKGVSTKLGKGMNWGLPVLSTVAGNRGYFFNGYTIPTYTTATQMAVGLVHKLNNITEIKADKLTIENIVNNSQNLNQHFNNISTLLASL